MKKTILAGIAGAAIAGAIGFAAPAAQAAPCSYFGNNPGTEAYNGICGTPDLADSILHAGTNLQKNFNPSTAATNLQQALTHGVGTDDPPA
jgi:hypothetical protein